MKMALGGLVLGLALVGCGGAQVSILTAKSDGCMLNWVRGELVEVPGGVGIIAEEQNGKRELLITFADGMSATRGWTGGIDIHAADGQVVGSTGQRVKLLGGYGGEDGWTTCHGGILPPQ